MLILHLKLYFVVIRYVDFVLGSTIVIRDNLKIN
jgi:hypothetical protein